MNTSLIKNTAVAAVTAFAVLGASIQASSALPLDIQTLKQADSASTVQTVGWTTKQKQAAGWGAAAGLLTGIIITGAVNKKKKNNAMKMHIAYCSGKHPTYDPETNMYMSNNGPKFCGSPYL